MLESSALVGRRVEWMVVFNGTRIFAFPAFGRTPGLDVGVWRDGFAR